MRLLGRQKNGSRRQAFSEEGGEQWRVAGDHISNSIEMFLSSVSLRFRPHIGNGGALLLDQKNAFGTVLFRPHIA